MRRQLVPVILGRRFPSWFKAGNLSTWRAAREATRSGSTRTRVMMHGDSTAVGFGSGSGGDGGGDCRMSAFLVWAAKYIHDSGVPSTTDGFYGMDLDTGTDTRIAFGDAHWTVNVGTIGLGGEPFRNSTAACVENFNITPGVGAAGVSGLSFDRVDMLYQRINGGNGLTEFGIDGGAAIDSLNMNGANAPLVKTISASLGTHTLNVRRQAGSGAGVNIHGFDFYNTASPRVSFLQSGRHGIKVAALASTGTYSTMNCTAALHAQSPVSLQIFHIGGNDVGSTTKADYMTDLNTCVAAASVYSSVFISIFPPQNPATNSYAVQEDIRQGAYEVAAANNASVLDNYKRWGSYENAVAQNWMAADGVHRNLAGHQEIGTALGRALLF